ncbi:MAG TPA: phosphotransferase, partial [Gemmatimonadaceae bacterium]|nr:phosphotransferase [Gemmatimonadaceae bacterium]
VIAGEQSNTSIVYGDHAILKLFRRLEPGEHPDVEIGRFLTTRTNFHGTPALLGVITFEWDGAPSVAGMLQRFVPGAQDAWDYALRSARDYLRAKGEAPRNPFAGDAERLGRVTRAMHEALASDTGNPAFAPERATGDDLERWARDARATMARSLELLESRVQAKALDPRATAAARALLGRRDALDDRVTEMVSAIGDDVGMRIRTHGDYHLGQVLRTPDGHFLVIDFEGEPARPLAERRAKVSPLRDVAGMVRSFAYVASMSARDVAGETVNPTVEIRSAHWERDARTAFLDGYLHAGKTSPESPVLLSHTRDDTQALLTLFETEKVFYELAYELNNRPEWVWVPLRGIAKLL